MEHTFAICAYGDSAYLEKCILSLLRQSRKSRIIICTSTPSNYIYSLSQKYNLDLYINNEKKGIGADWNFAYKMADTKLVTIAHQDDIYLKDYTKAVLTAKELYQDMSMFTCDAGIIKNNKVDTLSVFSFIKKILRLPLITERVIPLKWIKRMSISFGNPIICPACTYNKELCGENIFSEQYSFVLDWYTLYKLSSKKGRWICVEKPLILYRIHKEATTKKCILDNRREVEEKQMFDILLGKNISKIIRIFYRGAYAAYK